MMKIILLMTFDNLPFELHSFERSTRGDVLLWRNTCCKPWGGEGDGCDVVDDGGGDGDDDGGDCGGDGGNDNDFYQSSALLAGNVGDTEGRTGPGQLSFGHLGLSVWSWL